MGLEDSKLSTFGHYINTPSNPFQTQASSSTHIQLDDMSQHPQYTVHYDPLARSPTKSGVTKQNGVPVIIDDDDDGNSDDGGHETNHNHRQTSVTSPRRSTSGRGRVSRSWSRRSGSPTLALAHGYGVDDECTGLITPNGMEVPLATVDQKRRKWWRDGLINLCFIGAWYVDVVCWLSSGSIDIAILVLFGFEASRLGALGHRVVSCNGRLEGLAVSRTFV